MFQSEIRYYGLINFGHRIYFCVTFEIVMNSYKVYHCKNYHYHHPNIIQSSKRKVMTAKSKTVGELSQRTYSGEQCIDYYHEYPELSRTHAGVCQSEFFLQMSVDADVDGYQEIHHQSEKCNLKVHKAR